MDTQRRCVLSRSRVLRFSILDTGSLRLGKPNELDAFHLAAGYQATRYCFFYGPAESLAPRVGLLLVSPVRRVLFVKFRAHQLDVAGAHLGPVREWPDVSPTIGKDGQQDAP